MTFDVIATARRRTQRRFAVVLLVGAGLLGVCVYPAGLYVNAHLDDQAAPAPAAPSVAGSWPAGHDPTGGAPLLPADTVWVRVAGVELPAAASTGPDETAGGLARGFAPTPAGAVVAAAHLLVRTAPQVGPAVFDPTLAQQVTGEYAAAMRTVVTDIYTRAAADAGLTYGQPLGDLPAALVGVRVESFTPAQATIAVLTSVVDAAGVTRYAAAPVTVMWVGGDWHLLAPPQGRWDALVRLVDPDQIGTYVPLQGR